MVDKSKLRRSPNVVFVNTQIDRFKKYLIQKAIQLSNGQSVIPELQISTQSFLLSMINASRNYVKKSTGVKPPITAKMRQMIRVKSNEFLKQFLENYQKVTNTRIRQADLSGDSIDTFDWMFDRDSSDLMIGTYNQSLNLMFAHIPQQIDIKKVFTTMEDDRVCDDCDDNDGDEYDPDDDSAPDIPDDTHPNCYSDDTEIYTNRGWKLFKDLNKSELILSLNIKTKNLEYVKPTQYISYHYEGKMINFKHRWNDLLVTPNHNMLVRHDDSSDFRFVSAKDVKRSHQFYRTSEWIGNDVKTVIINDLEIDAKTFCRFMGYWLSEGNVTQRTKHGFEIKISQCKQKNLQIMFDNMSYLPIKVNRGQDRLLLYNASLGSYLQQFGKSYEKYVPDIIKDMSSDLIREFLDAYLLGDGHVCSPKEFKNIKFNESREHASSSKRMIEDIGELILKIGKVPRFTFKETKGKSVKFKNGTYVIKTNMYRVSENNTISSTVKNMNINKVDYNGIVYCVELPINHTLYVRRNGQCSWCGNCRCWYVMKVNGQEMDDI